MISMQDGTLTKGNKNIPLHSLTHLRRRIGAKIASHWSSKKYEVTEIGIMHPEEVPVPCLYPGQVGYMACNMKQSSEGKCNIFESFHFINHGSFCQLTLAIRSTVLERLSNLCRGLRPLRQWYGCTFYHCLIRQCEPTFIRCSLAFSPSTAVTFQN